MQLNEEYNYQPTSGKIGVANLRAALPTLKAHLIFWLLIIAGIILDLWTKRAVFDWLQSQPFYSFSVIDGIVQLVIAENSGAAFGIAAGKTTLLIAVSIIAMITIVAVFLFSRIKPVLTQISLALLAAGVFGNLWDRIFNQGRVRDFIDVVYWPGKHWPAFNIADTMLCIGVALMILSNMRAGGLTTERKDTLIPAKSSQTHAQQRK